MTQRISLDAGDAHKIALSFMGAPWAEHARGPVSYDCYGLYRAFIHEAFGVYPPDFLYTKETEKETIKEVSALLPGFVPVEYPAPGDLVLLNYFGDASHVGIYLGYNDLLHTQKITAAHIVRLTDKEGLRTISSRIVRWYRWQIPEHTS